MIDTNQILQAGQAAQTAIEQANAIKGQINPWMISAIGFAAGWAGREISRACAAARNCAEWFMAHGGIIKIGIKLFWNSEGTQTTQVTQIADKH